ncbi:hypothetical protein DRQ33_08130, partial [bacterium]
MEKVLLQLIWLPAAGGALCLILLRVKGAESFIDWIRRLIMLFVSAYTLYLGWLIFKNPQVYIVVGTVGIGSLSTRLILRATPLAALMVLFTCFFAFLTSIFSMKYRSGEMHNNWYYAMALGVLSAANAVFFAGDFLTFTIFWEISTLFLFGLIALGNNEKTPFAAAKTLVILGLAEAGMLFAIAYIWVTHGTLVFTDISLPLNSTINIILYFLIASAALAKAGAIPLHSWMPTASEG